MTLLATDAQLEGALEQLTGELERWHVPALELAVVREGTATHAGEPNEKKPPPNGDRAQNKLICRGAKRFPFSTASLTNCRTPTGPC